MAYPAIFITHRVKKGSIAIPGAYSEVEFDGKLLEGCRVVSTTASVDGLVKVQIEMLVSKLDVATIVED